MIDKSKFRHVETVRVRSNEVDWQGVVHNAVYLHYFEVGRMGYFESVGFPVVTDADATDWRVVIGRNEIDYRSAARFNDLLTVHTRISWIRNSSFAIQGYIEQAKTGIMVAENVSLHVWLDRHTNQPITVPQFFRNLIRSYEGDSVLITPISVSI